ncbi:hypothetical protein C0J52_20116 [Blattella germanica]|nr:hypothetical protein C0J52_20116 [Blattella germanica]
MVIGSHLVGASAATVANIVGVSKGTVSSVMGAYSMHGQTTSAKQNSGRKTVSLVTEVNVKRRIQWCKDHKECTVLKSSGNT